jgi:hypothetical protein
VAHGTAGVGDRISPSRAWGTLDKNGNLLTTMSGDRIPTGYQVSPDLWQGLNEPAASLEVSNSQIMVVGLVQGAQPIPRFVAFRKRDKTWHVIPSHSFLYWCLRGFGEFVAITETTAKKRPASEALASTPANSGTAVAQTPGRLEWRKKDSLFGPDIAESFDDAPAIYPGRLHLFDVETDRVFTIDTKQGDSEILLVEDGIMYYRISDRLCSAHVTDKGIGGAHLLAKDEAIRDVHWAFIKHSGSRK